MKYKYSGGYKFVVAPTIIPNPAEIRRRVLEIAESMGLFLSEEDASDIADNIQDLSNIEMAIRAIIEERLNKLFQL